MKRRDFLKVTGAGVALAIAPEAGHKIYWEKIWQTKDWEDQPRGPTKLVPTVCQQCQGGCGALVTMVGERAIKIDGNPSHPISQGTLCPKGQAGLQTLYHPSRIRSPLKRVGNRGAGEWEPISWDEALDTISAELKNVRDRGDAHKVVFVDGESQGLMKELIGRFMQVCGSPNYIPKIKYGDEGFMKALPQNTDGLYDIGSADFVLSFGFNFIEALFSPVTALRAHGQLRKDKKKIVYVGSRLSVTGIKANEWVPSNPGTDGILALGLARVIIEEELYNKSYIRKVSNFEDFKDVVLSHSLSSISDATGVKEETIVKMAREFSSHGPSAVALGNSGNVNDQIAVNSLNILTGSIEKLWWDYDTDKIPFTKFPRLRLDATASKGLAMQPIAAPNGRFPLASPRAPQLFEILPDQILQGDPYDVSVLFLYYTNPVLSTPNPEKFINALQKIPLIVSFSPFLDESSQFSDLILPDHTYLERWQDAPQFTVEGIPVLGIRQPVVKPLYQTMHTGDVLIRIARRMGEPLAKAFPWDDFRDLLLFAVEGVFDSKKGGIAPEKGFYEHVLLDYEESSGVERVKNFKDWFQALIERGWWDPEKKTLTRRAEFQIENIKDIEVGGEHHDEEFHFHLNVYKLMTLTMARNTVQPTLFDIAAPHVYRKWVAWVEINPETAHELGIEDEDWVWVESPLGRDKFKAKLYPGTMPEVVNIPLIIGSKGFAPWTKDIEQNPFKIIQDASDPLDGHYIYDTKVRIHKVKEDE
ncbi:MAG: molybdopterin-dependent oxidoreductase [Candidatus Hydrothermarchaeales archaeon]